ncbi:MAG: hypothetical protein QGD94_08890, partial [Planctomycetia bacterium]|nr:hypothetical protein [Planctomycetia bacterium]
MHAIAAEAVNGKETPDTDKVTTEELGKALATSKAMSRSRMLAASRVVPGMLKAGILLDGIVVPMAAVLIWILPKVGEPDWPARNVLVYLLFCFTVPLLFGIATPLYIMGFRE